jgi:hypothetical protein
MSDKKTPQTAQDALEIIELALSDLETLTRAFHVIDEVCQEMQCSEQSFPEPCAKVIMN